MGETSIYIVQGLGVNLNAPGSQQIADRLVDSVETCPDNLKGQCHRQ